MNDYYDPQPVGGAADQACRDRTPAALVYQDDGYCVSSFVPLRWTEKRFHEGQAEALVVSHQSFEYDGYGNVSVFHDAGDVADPSDDLTAKVTYRPVNEGDLYCPGAPVDIVATDRSGNVLRQRKGTYDAQCRMTVLESLVGGTQWTEAKLEYWGAGAV